MEEDASKGAGKGADTDKDASKGADRGADMEEDAVKGADKGAAMEEDADKVADKGADMEETGDGTKASTTEGAGSSGGVAGGTAPCPGMRVRASFDEASGEVSWVASIIWLYIICI